MTLHNILFVTGTRAEYGIMKPLLIKLNSIDTINLDVVVTGTHLESEYGYTLNQIIEDDLNILTTINLQLKDTSMYTIGKSLGILTTELNNVFNNKNYDMVIILGDRYEMLPVANLSVLYKVPICHLHGGELTYGNYDEHIRHALTKMSSLHLTSTEEYKNRVISLGENPNRVFNIGAIGVENALQKLLSKEALSIALGVDLPKDYYVVLYHPATLYTEEMSKTEMNGLLEFIKNIDDNVFIIGNNADTGAKEFRDEIDKLTDNKRIIQFKSLEANQFHSLVKYSKGIVGNSSSGIIEVPSLEVPTINIGKRQLGRIYSDSVFNVDGNYEEILKASKTSLKNLSYVNPYYKDGSVDSAVDIICSALNEGIDSSKIFYEK